MRGRVTAFPVEAVVELAGGGGAARLGANSETPVDTGLASRSSPLLGILVPRETLDDA